MAARCACAGLRQARPGLASASLGLAFKQPGLQVGGGAVADGSCAAGPRLAGPGRAGLARACLRCRMARLPRCPASGSLSPPCAHPCNAPGPLAARLGRPRLGQARLRRRRAGSWCPFAPAPAVAAAHRAAAEAGSRQRAALFGAAEAGPHGCWRKLHFARAGAQGAARGRAQHPRACRLAGRRGAGGLQSHAETLSTHQHAACAASGRAAARAVRQLP